MAVSDLISNHHAQGRLAAPGPFAFTADAPRDVLGPKASFVPAPPTLFTGRRQAAASVRRALGRVPMAIVYGVAGVGKSALGYACAAAFPGPVCYLQAEAERPLPALVRELFRRAAFDRVGPTDEDGDEACGAALADALDERGALLVLDDVDRLPPSVRDVFLRALGERLRRGRVIATARSRVHAPGHYDRQELLVRGLDRASAKRLWQGLDGLHGSKAGFEAAYRITQGYPSSLRRAHAGHPPDDPHAALVATLDTDARLIAAAVALAGAPVGAAALRAALPGDRGVTAQRVLVERLLLDIDGAGICSLYEPARDAVMKGLAPAGLALADVYAALETAALPALGPGAGPSRPALALLAPLAGPTATSQAYPMVDARCHELRAGERTLHLAGRPVLRGLLYALASRPNELVSKEALVSAVWSVRYHPLRHDNMLFVSVRRLRDVLAGTGLAVRNDGGGYALAAPPAFVYLAPAA